MKKIFQFIVTITLCLQFIGCEKEAAIPYNAYVEKIVLENATDSAIYAIYKDYQTKVIYDWDRKYISSNATAAPPRYELVRPYVDNIVRKMIIAPYDRQNPNFLRENMPIEIVLMGSSINFASEEGGFSSTGGAVSLSRILITGVNSYDLKNRSFTKGQAVLFAHELAHILDKKYGRPIGFDQISAGKYAGGASVSSFSLQEARNRGFWRNYGMSNQIEDFGTWVEGIVGTKKSEVLALVAQNQYLGAKYRAVYNYFLDKGIDLHVLNENIERIGDQLSEL